MAPCGRNEATGAPSAMTVAVCLAALAASILGVYLLEERAGVRDASTVFLLAVALVAYLRGSWAAVATALGAFLAYNYLFLPPEFTFLVSDPQHILTLGLLLAVGVGHRAAHGPAAGPGPALRAA